MLSKIRKIKKEKAMINSKKKKINNHLLNMNNHPQKDNISDIKKT